MSGRKKVEIYTEQYKGLKREMKSGIESIQNRWEKHPNKAEAREGFGKEMRAFQTEMYGKFSNFADGLAKKRAKAKKKEKEGKAVRFEEE